MEEKNEVVYAKATEGRTTLLVGGMAALLAATCCLGPLLLLMLGISGAWIGNLTALEPYRPIFMVVAGLALLLSGRRIFRPAAACQPGEVCAMPQVRATYKALFGVVALLFLIAAVFPFLLPYFY